MAKVTARNAIVVIGGYFLSTYATQYETSYGVEPIEVTGFTDGWRNYIPGLYQGQMSLSMLWDEAAGKSFDALQPLGQKCVTVLPEGFALGNPAICMHAEQESILPGAAPNGALSLGNIAFQTSGVDGGPIPANVMAHATITNTATSAAFQGLASAGTYKVMGFLHIWTACAADTYAVKFQHCATSGGVYADLLTFTLNGSAIGSEHVLVASGTVQPYWKVVATRTGAAGNNFGYTASIAAYV